MPTFCSKVPNMHEFSSLGGKKKKQSAKCKPLGLCASDKSIDEAMSPHILHVFLIVGYFTENRAEPSPKAIEIIVIDHQLATKLGGMQELHVLKRQRPLWIQVVLQWRREYVRVTFDLATRPKNRPALSHANNAIASYWRMLAT